jgi:hypothetical protein
MRLIDAWGFYHRCEFLSHEFAYRDQNLSSCHGPRFVPPQKPLRCLQNAAAAESTECPGLSSAGMMPTPLTDGTATSYVAVARNARQEVVAQRVAMSIEEP